MKRVSDKLKEKIDSLPDKPGIYKMLDREGRIIYIGKSISLKKRVKSYFRENPERRKVEKMYPLIDDIDYKVMDTDLEAKLEECRLIKELKPIFNSQFKKDKNYVYIKIKEYNPYNPLSLSYIRNGECYGPFRNMSLVRNVLSSLKNLYPINWVDNRYSFKYDIIPVSMNREEFLENQNSLKQIFENKNRGKLFMDELEEKMKKASMSLKFETALYYKNLVDGFKYIDIYLRREEEMFLSDIFLKIEIENGYKLFFIKKGDIVLKEKFKILNRTREKEFIKRGKKIDSKNSFKDEKVNLDFRDILIGEINKWDYKIC